MQCILIRPSVYGVIVQSNYLTALMVSSLDLLPGKSIGIVGVKIHVLIDNFPSQSGDLTNLSVQLL